MTHGSAAFGPLHLIERETSFFPESTLPLFGSRWEGKIVEEPETALLVKTQPGYRQAIEQVVRQHISYTNLMAEIAPESVNESFVNWLNAEVPLAAGGARKTE